MNRRIKCLIALITAACSMSVHGQTPKDTRPNVIVILADDLGYNDISINGNKFIQTPNIDKIANDGVKFTQGYVTSPNCSPSRAAIITGRHQARFGLEYTIKPGSYKNTIIDQSIRDNLTYLGYSPEKRELKDTLTIDKHGLPKSEITLASLLLRNGYKTAAVGKWHLGENNPDFFPENRGFQSFYGIYTGASLYETINSSAVVNEKLPWYQLEYPVWNTPSDKPVQLIENKEKVTATKYLTYAFADKAVAFIDKNKANPFFLYLAFNAPHTPIQAPKAIYDSLVHIKDPTKRTYYAMVVALDQAIGQVNDKLRALGLDKNTIVVFATDNGGATYTRAADNAPFKGGKYTEFEGGIHIPFFIKWPAQIKAGTVYDKPVSTLDIFATTVKAASVALPSDRTYDGQDLLPYITGKNKDNPHELLFWRNGYIYALRKQNWKLIVNTRLNQLFLYDLSSDPFEKNNLSESNKEKVKELLQEYTNWNKQNVEPIWPGLFNIKILVDGELYYMEG